jgi:hypothetical protein
MGAARLLLAVAEPDANVLTMAARAAIDLPFRVVIGYN